MRKFWDWLTLFAASSMQILGLGITLIFWQLVIRERGGVIWATAEIEAGLLILSFVAKVAIGAVNKRGSGV